MTDDIPSAPPDENANQRFTEQVMSLYREGKSVDEITKLLREETARPDGVIDLTVPDSSRRSIHPWDILGNAYRIHGRYEQAHQLYRALIEEMLRWARDRGGDSAPLYGMALNDFGLVFLAERRLGEALIRFWEALRWDSQAGSINLNTNIAAKNLDIVIRATRDRFARQDALQAVDFGEWSRVGDSRLSVVSAVEELRETRQGSISWPIHLLITLSQNLRLFTFAAVLIWVFVFVGIRQVDWRRSLVGGLLIVIGLMAPRIVRIRSGAIGLEVEAPIPGVAKGEEPDVVAAPAGDG